jgi:hypothetical protein
MGGGESRSQHKFGSTILTPDSGRCRWGQLSLGDLLSRAGQTLRTSEKSSYRDGIMTGGVLQ